MSANRSCASPTLAGNTIYLPLVVTNTSDVPTASDTSPPTGIIFYALADLASKSNPISSGITVSAVSGETGLYVISRDSTGMAVGNYTALVPYLLSTAARRQFIDFAIA